MISTDQGPRMVMSTVLAGCVHDDNNCHSKKNNDNDKGIGNVQQPRVTMLIPMVLMLALTTMMMRMMMKMIMNIMMKMMTMIRQ